MKTIVCFGDSNTWGCPPDPYDPVVVRRLPPSQRWPNVLAAGLGDQAWMVEEGLNGRTTVFDDPIEGQHRNGARALPIVLDSHAPIDLLIIMLGTNDLKSQFGIEAVDSVRGVDTLVRMVRGHHAAKSRPCPRILLLTPAAITAQADPGMWRDGVRKSADHAALLADVAARNGCAHFDVNSVASAGPDGVHLDAPEHRALGEALIAVVRPLLDV